MPGADETGLALHVRDVQADGLFDLGPDARGAGFPLRCQFAVAGLLSRQR
jgi:hypothetical protein